MKTPPLTLLESWLCLQYLPRFSWTPPWSPSSVPSCLLWITPIVSVSVGWRRPYSTHVVAANTTRRELYIFINSDRVMSRYTYDTTLGLRRLPSTAVGRVFTDSRKLLLHPSGGVANRRTSSVIWRMFCEHGKATVLRFRACVQLLWLLQTYTGVTCAFIGYVNGKLIYCR